MFTLQHGETDVADLIKLRVLRWRDYPGLPAWAQCNQESLTEGGGRMRNSEKRCDSGSRSGSDVLCRWREGPHIKECRWPLEAAKARKLTLS